MEAFRKALSDFEVDGIWLDYHHAHASWEQAVPNLPDTCFCAAAWPGSSEETGVDLPDRPTPELAAMLLGPHKASVGRAGAAACSPTGSASSAPSATRSAPGRCWGRSTARGREDDFGGALRDKLAIDLKAQAEFLDVFSPMPYHARFGHADDPAWVSRQVAWLGRHLGVEGKPGERLRIWPIVQLSEWGEPVPAAQVAEVIDHGTRPPATGVTVFAWGGWRTHPAKIEAIGETFRAPSRACCAIGVVTMRPAARCAPVIQ